MVSNQSKRQIENLRREIEKANEAYYIEENSSMSDFEYDKKFRELTMKTGDIGIIKYIKNKYEIT